MRTPESDVYFNAPGVATVRWDDGVVLVEWEGWANSTEFTALLEAEISALSDHRGSCLLADCRRQRVLSPADQALANQNWLPLALATGLKRFAVVIPASRLAEMNLRDSLAKAPRGLLEVAYFDTPEEARAWLARR